MGRANLVIVLALGLGLAALESSGAQQIASASSGSECSTCTCYYSSDCGDSSYSCGDYGQCTAKGKLDGLCKNRGITEVWSSTDLSIVADAVEEYFDAFHEASRDTTGGNQTAARQRLVDAQSHRLSVLGHAAVRSLVIDALDLTIGFDLVHENLRLCSEAGPLPTVRAEMSVEADALVAAVRQGLADAIRANDSSLVEPPIRSFWSLYPSYEPHHTGRCYDHGHAGHPYASPADCQVSEIRGLTELVLPQVGGASATAPFEP